MPPPFLVLLVSAFGSILVSVRASHEIPRILAIGSAMFCLIFGFAMAPWMVQLPIFLVFLSWARPYRFVRISPEP